MFVYLLSAGAGRRRRRRSQADSENKLNHKKYLPTSDVKEKTLMKLSSVRKLLDYTNKTPKSSPITESFYISGSRSVGKIPITVRRLSTSIYPSSVYDIANGRNIGRKHWMMKPVNPSDNIFNVPKQADFQGDNPQMLDKLLPSKYSKNTVRVSTVNLTGLPTVEHSVNKSNSSSSSKFINAQHNLPKNVHSAETNETHLPTNNAKVSNIIITKVPHVK